MELNFLLKSINDASISQILSIISNALLIITFIVTIIGILTWFFKKHFTAFVVSLFSDTSVRKSIETIISENSTISSLSADFENYNQGSKDFFGNIVDLFESHMKTMGDLLDAKGYIDCKLVHDKMKTSYTKIPFYAAHSPINLTERGNAMLIDTGIKSMLDTTFTSEKLAIIFPKTKNPAEIDKFSEEIRSSELAEILWEENSTLIRNKAFELGISDNLMHRIITLYIRNLFLSSIWIDLDSFLASEDEVK